jgi:glycosyltransferase 2 family protein
MKFSRPFQLAAGLALAAGGLYIFFHNVDVARLKIELLSCKPHTIIICALISMLTILIRALRWKVMLPDAERAHKNNLFPIVAISFMLNNILPARLGEAARVVLLWKKNNYNPAQSIGSIVMERIFDTLAFMSSFFVPVIFIKSLRDAHVTSAIFFGKNLTMGIVAMLFAACVAFVCGILFFYTRMPEKTGGIASYLLKLLPTGIGNKLNSIGADVFSNLKWIFSIKKVIIVIAYTTLMMVCYGLIMAIITDRHGFTIVHGVFANSFAAMGAAIPLAPGFVGTLHAVLLQGLLFCGLDRDKAVAVTILYHAIPYCAVTALGLFFFLRMKLNFKELSSPKQPEKKSAEKKT